MTQAAAQKLIRENTLLDKFRNLTSEQQQTILDVMGFMESKNPKSPVQEVSADDLAKEWAGSVESGIGDLFTNKKYLQRLGK